MEIIEEKLERFTNDIMKEVSIKRKEIFESVEQAYREKFDKKQTKYLNENYVLIQESLKKIDKEKNEMISKAIMDINKKMLNKRKEIIELVFEQAKTKIKEHTQDKNYFEELVLTIKRNINEIGEGDLEIIISFSDRNHLEALKQIFSQSIILENKNVEMLGGCKIVNKTKNLFIDDSYAKRLEYQKDFFLQNSNIRL